VVLELVEVETVVDAVTAARFVSERVEYIAAVRPAPVAALTAAIMAIVDLDILKSVEGRSEGFCCVESHSGQVIYRYGLSPCERVASIIFCPDELAT